MELSPRNMLNPQFAQRLAHIRTARMCRFCLAVSSSLISIPDSDRIQMLISECYHGCLGTLKGNASRFVCTSCYQRLEQSYEFLLLASRVQALVDTYTFHDGSWPCQTLLEDTIGRKGEKRVASPDDDGERRVLPSKKVRFEDFSEEEEIQQLEEPIGRCDTPGVLSEYDMERSEASLERTLSGEISVSDLAQVCCSSSSAGSGMQFDSSHSEEYEKKTAVLGRELSMVHNLCLQIQAFGVGCGPGETKLLVNSKDNAFKILNNSYQRGGDG